MNADILSRESQLLDNPTQQEADETHINKIFPIVKLANWMPVAYVQFHALVHAAV